MKVITKKRQRKLLGVMLIAMVGLPISPLVSAQDTQQLLPLLKGYEWKLQPQLFQNLGEDADLALMEIASDTALMNAYRFRALEALKLFEKERVARFLENYMEQNQNASLLRRAFEALSSGFSNSQPERVQQAAQKLLGNSNPYVRISAVRALRQLDTSNSGSAYRNYLNTEKEAWIRQAIEK